MFLPLLLLSVSSDVMLEEQTLPRDVGRVLSVFVIVQLLTRFPSGLRFRVISGLLRVCVLIRRENIQMTPTAQLCAVNMSTDNCFVNEMFRNDCNAVKVTKSSA